MNSKELFHMLGDIGADPKLPDLSEYKVVTADGRSVTGIWTDHDTKEVIMVQRDRRTETRVDL
jgi:hypothetical protein